MDTLAKMIVPLLVICALAFVLYLSFSSGKIEDQVATKPEQQQAKPNDEEQTVDPFEETVESQKETRDFQNQEGKQFFAKAIDQQPSYQERDSYIQEIESSAENMQKELDALAKQGGANKKDIDKLEKMLSDELEQKLEKLKSVSEQDWEDSVSELNAYLEKLDKQFQQISSKQQKVPS